MRSTLTAVVMVLSACAASGVQDTRFRNADPVWQVNDRVHTPQPETRGFARLLYYFDRFFFRRTTRLLEVPTARHAVNVNSVDEVPNSTWFTNRLGVGQLSPERVGQGPSEQAGPVTTAPWRVTGTKVGGVSVGLLITDAAGTKYILKFDNKGVPDMETAANVVLQRLFWAAGFNVPEDSIVFFRRSQLVLAPTAEVKDTFGNTRPMTQADLDAQLALVNMMADGRYRGMASKFLDGVPLGGVEPEGTRSDDPNDVVPHEDRRDLRGQYVLFSWTNHTDVKSDNLLDMWVQDPDRPNIRYVKHYLVDFGKGLGTLGWMNNAVTDGFAHTFDFAWSLHSLVALGTYRRPWEGARSPPLRGVGHFEAARFQPNKWSPRYPWTPFQRRDRFDGLWGAKLVAAFTKRHIAAAVAAGRYSDPRAARYITDTLVKRRRKIMEYWFGVATPIAHPRIDSGGAVCFDDLAVTHRVFSAHRHTTYAAASFDYNGTPLSALAMQSTRCMEPPTPGPSHQGYTIVKISPFRRGVPALPVEIHLAERDGSLRVIGLVRH